MMTMEQISARAEKQGAGGLDFATALADCELSQGHSLTEEELRAFHDGWKKSWPARDARQAKRDAEAAEQARKR